MNKNIYLSRVRWCVFFIFVMNTNNLFAQQTFVYTYDALGRLTVENDAVNGNRNFTYDAAGNRTQVSIGTPTAPAVPAAPKGLSCTPIPNVSNRYTANWTQVSSATSYVVTSNTGSVTVSAPSVAVLGLCLNVKACNAVGCSTTANF